MDKEIFKGLIEHIKKHGVKSTGLIPIVSMQIVIPIGNIEVELTLQGTEDSMLGIVEWDKHIWVSGVSNSIELGSLHEDGYKSHIHSYTYKGVKDLEDIITRLVSDYREFQYKWEQESLERMNKEKLLEEKVKDFLYKG